LTLRRSKFKTVIKHDSVRALLALIAAHKLHYIQYDIKTAFLNGNLDELIFMSQPEGYIDLDHPRWVCRLKKSIYGLKQAARQWNRKFDFFLKAHNLVPLDVDSCVYVSQDNPLTITGIFVDDGISASVDPTRLQVIISHLKMHFEIITSSGEYYVGFQICRPLDTSEIFIHQHHYVNYILERFCMQECKSMSTPSDPHSRLVAATTTNDIITVPFKEAIGYLFYAALVSRPDISYVVSAADKHYERPTAPHWAVVKRIFRYLQGTRDYGLLYTVCPQPSLLGYCDSDFAADLDDRKSHSGYVFLLAGAPVARQVECLLFHKPSVVNHQLLLLATAQWGLA
jgi:hypothetical protein